MSGPWWRWMRRLLRKKTIAEQLRFPSEEKTRRWTVDFIVAAMRERHAVDEHCAVRLLDIQPDDKVLEIGFGSAVGLKAACERIEAGKGAVFGVDPSPLVRGETARLCKAEIDSGKLMILRGSAHHLPFRSDQIDKVFHCNTHYYWENLEGSCREILRVLKRNGRIITVFDLDRLKRDIDDGLIDSSLDTNPLEYMLCLERAGFEGVTTKYDLPTGDKFGQSFRGVEAFKPTTTAIIEEDLEDDLIELGLQVKDFMRKEFLQQTKRLLVVETKERGIKEQQPSTEGNKQAEPRRQTRTTRVIADEIDEADKRLKQFMKRHSEREKR